MYSNTILQTINHNHFKSTKIYRKIVSQQKIQDSFLLVEKLLKLNQS